MCSVFALQRTFEKYPFDTDFNQYFPNKVENLEIYTRDRKSTPSMCLFLVQLFYNLLSDP